jgi:hypothetical protein
MSFRSVFASQLHGTQPDLVGRQFGGEVMHWQPVRIAALCALVAVPAFAQQPAAPASSNAICTYEDGTEIRVSYSSVSTNDKKELPRDKMWTPGNQPMIFFTTSPISLGGTVVPPGAYALYMIPGKSAWTLVVNKDVTPGHEYDAKQDVVRASMEVGKLTEPQPLQLGFARMGPKQCDLRLYYGQIGTWTNFNEQ